MYVCSKGVIKILVADYYAIKADGSHCGGLVTELIAARCDGLASCIWYVNNANVGTDPCVGPKKTLYTTYTCT